MSAISFNSSLPPPPPPLPLSFIPVPGIPANVIGSGCTQLEPQTTNTGILPYLLELKIQQTYRVEMENRIKILEGRVEILTQTSKGLINTIQALLKQVCSLTQKNAGLEDKRDRQDRSRKRPISATGEACHQTIDGKKAKTEYTQKDSNT